MEVLYHFHLDGLTCPLLHDISNWLDSSATAGTWKFNMSQVVRLDITVDTENISEGVYQILGQLRPDWKRGDVHIKVIYLCYSPFITFCIRPVKLYSYHSIYIWDCYMLSVPRWPIAPIISLVTTTGGTIICHHLWYQTENNSTIYTTCGNIEKL